MRILIPRLAEVEDDDTVDGVLILLNTLGGDAEAGLAIAEMIASLSKPTVSLVLEAVIPSADLWPFRQIILLSAPSGTMIVYPVRSSGMFIGVIQSYRNMEKNAGSDHTVDCVLLPDHKRTAGRTDAGFHAAGQDVGTLLEGEDAVRER